MFFRLFFVIAFGVFLWRLTNADHNMCVWYLCLWRVFCFTFCDETEGNESNKLFTFTFFHFNSTTNRRENKYFIWRKSDDDEHEDESGKSSGKMLICGKFAVMRVGSKIRESSQPWRTTTEKWKLFILGYRYVYFLIIFKEFKFKRNKPTRKMLLENFHSFWGFCSKHGIFPFAR